MNGWKPDNPSAGEPDSESPRPGGAIASLLPNVQFLYELRLAALELECFSPHARILPDFRSFAIEDDGAVENILKRSAYIGGAGGGASDYAKLTRYNLTRAFNQYITHWFYPYKGKYHPQMVRALANIIGMKEGDTLLDPFIGSGTTAVEGALLNLAVIGFDISPLCALISEVKANAVHHFAKIEKAHLNKRPPGKPSGQSGAQRRIKDPVKRFDLLARMIATSDSARRGRDFDAMLAGNREKMIQSIRLMRDACAETGISPAPADIREGDARRLPLPDNSVDGVITSPPYSLALNYVENDAHSLQALGCDPDRIRDDFIGVRGKGGEKIGLYEQDMAEAYAEIARVLKPAGQAAIVIGDATVGGQKVRSARNCIDTFGQLGFKLLHHVDKLIYGLYNVMQREAILVFGRRENNEAGGKAAPKNQLARRRAAGAILAEPTGRRGRPRRLDWICTFPGCDRRRKSKHYCASHSLRAQAGRLDIPIQPTRGRAAIKRTCAIAGCGKKHIARGLCATHYQRRRRAAMK